MLQREGKREGKAWGGLIYAEVSVFAKGRSFSIPALVSIHSVQRKERERIGSHHLVFRGGFLALFLSLFTSALFGGKKKRKSRPKNTFTDDIDELSLSEPSFLFSNFRLGKRFPVSVCRVSPIQGLPALFFVVLSRMNERTKEEWRRAVSSSSSSSDLINNPSLSFCWLSFFLFLSLSQLNPLCSLSI